MTTASKPARVRGLGTFGPVRALSPGGLIVVVPSEEVLRTLSAALACEYVGAVSALAVRGAVLRAAEAMGRLRLGEPLTMEMVELLARRDLTNVLARESAATWGRH